MVLSMGLVANAQTLIYDNLSEGNGNNNRTIGDQNGIFAGSLYTAQATSSNVNLIRAYVAQTSETQSSKPTVAKIYDFDTKALLATSRNVISYPWTPDTITTICPTFNTDASIEGCYTEYYFPDSINLNNNKTYIFAIESLYGTVDTDLQLRLRTEPDDDSFNSSYLPTDDINSITDSTQDFIFSIYSDYSPAGTSTPVIINPIDFNTRFTDISITGSSTSVDFDIDYFLDTSEYTSQNRPDVINISILANGFLGDQQVDTVQNFILPLQNGTSSKVLTSTYNHSDGDYIAYVNFFNLTSNNLTFTQTGIIANYSIVGGVVDSFSIDTVSDGLNITSQTQYQECSISNIYGCFVNALIFTFVPESNTFDRFVGLYETIENKPPFGYVTAIIDDLSGITSSTTPAFDLSNIPFIAAIFDPLKALLAIGLWVIYAFFFMGRLSKIDI